MENTISIGQLRQNPTQMIRDVKHGAVYTLTDRGQPVADIAPHRPAPWRSGVEVGALLADLGPDLMWAEELRQVPVPDEMRDPWVARE